MAWHGNDGVNASQDLSPVSSLVTVASFNKKKNEKRGLELYRLSYGSRYNLWSLTVLF